MRHTFILIIPLFAILFMHSHTAIYGQGQHSGNNAEYLHKAERFLNIRFDSLAYAENDFRREAINQTIMKKFRSLLRHESAFNYPFDSVSHVGIIRSADQKVKIYNWNVPYEGGYHVYHCFIQYRTKDSLMTFELKDCSEQIESPEKKVLHKDKWFGALYYTIIPKKGRFGETCYTLLGYDPNNYLTNRKIIDVLHFNKDHQPVFGADIFKNQRSVSKRVVFEYSEFATMTLQYDEQKDMIVYDHLAPSHPKYEGQYEFYGPDFSYDGLKYEQGIWNTYYDLDLRLNKINLND
jgi:hypothetical protein